MIKFIRNLFCKHEWSVVEISNIVQPDIMGYPLMLMIEKCKKCGRTKHVWNDVSKKVYDDENIHVLMWKNVEEKENESKNN